MNFPRPALLHDSRFVGEDKRAREARSRRLRTARGRARLADSHELQQLAGIIAAECDRRGVEEPDAVFAAGQARHGELPKGDGAAPARREAGCRGVTHRSP